MSKLIQDFLERFKSISNGEIKPPVDDCSDKFDSPWEEDFKWVLLKNLPDNFTLNNQKSFCGRYRVDYTITCNASGRVWVFEFDGRQYHEYYRDLQRDNEILAKHPEIQSITRVDAVTFKSEYDKTRGMLSKLTPECFKVDLSAISGGSYIFNGEVYLYEDEWISQDDILSSVVPNDSAGYCLDSMWDNDCMGYSPDTPMRKLQIIHRNNENR